MAAGAGRRAALASRGAGGARCKLTPAQVREVDAVLDVGPAVSGWDEDQCWTLARIAELVRRRFRVEYTLAGLDVLLHRLGWSVQVPARRAAERDEAGDRRLAGGDLAGGKSTAADLGARVCFEDESGQGLRPPAGRTWGCRGQTPVVRVTGGSNKRVSLAALAWGGPDDPGDWTAVRRTFRDGHAGTWWAADAKLGGWGPDSVRRLVVATGDVAPHRPHGGATRSARAKSHFHDRGHVPSLRMRSAAP